MSEQSNEQQQSGAGYGDDGKAQPGGGRDSSGGTGSTGGTQGLPAPRDDGLAGQSGAGYGDQGYADQAVQRSETIEAEDIEFEADRDLIDSDGA